MSLANSLARSEQTRNNLINYATQIKLEYDRVFSPSLPPSPHLFQKSTSNDLDILKDHCAKKSKEIND